MTKNQIAQIGGTEFSKGLTIDVFDGLSTTDLTLRLGIFGKYYSKTMPFKDSQDEAKVARQWNGVFEILKQEIGVGNVPTDNNNDNPIGGHNMSKEESIAKYHLTMDAQENAALGQVFIDGQAEGGAGFTKEDVDKAVADAIAALPPDTTPFDQAYVSAAVSKAVAEALAALPADQTPFSKEDLSKAVADAVAAVPKDEEMAKLLADAKAENAKLKEAIQAEIDDSKVDTSRLEAVLAPVLQPTNPTPTPEQPAPEVQG